FQAEDGIRDFHVTGVQTCALTISIGKGDLFVVTCGPGEISTALALLDVAKKAGAKILFITAQPDSRGAKFADFVLVLPAQTMAEIGRASCRERAQSQVVAGAQHET